MQAAVVLEELKIQHLANNGKSTNSHTGTLNKRPQSAPTLTHFLQQGHAS